MSENYDPDYGLCIRDCEKCEYNSKEGCGLDYNGEPWPTIKEIACFMLLTITIPCVLILLDIWGVI